MKTSTFMAVSGWMRLKSVRESPMVPVIDLPAMKIAILLPLLFLPVLLSAQEPEAGNKTDRGGADLRKKIESEEIESLKKELELDQERLELHERIAGAYLAADRFEEAIPHLRRALSLKKGSAEEYGALARLMIEQGEEEPALGVLDEAVERFPESADFPFLKTFPLAGLERWEDAVAAFRRTAELAEATSPEMLNVFFWYRYGAAHERIGNYDEAERFLRRSLALLMEVDATDEVADFFATVLNYLAYMWIERGVNLEEAGAMARDAAEINPESGPIADTVGWYYFQTGNYPRALVELKRAERLVEEADATIYDHIGQTLAKLGEKSFAAEYYRKALKLDPQNEELKSRLDEMEE